MQTGTQGKLRCVLPYLLPLPSCVGLGKLYNLFEFCFLYKKGYYDVPASQGCWGMKRVDYTMWEFLEQPLA